MEKAEAQEAVHKDGPGDRHLLIVKPLEMKKIIIVILFILSFLPLKNFAQNGMGDYINLKYGAFGLEYITDTMPHTNTTFGYYNVLPLTDAVIDTVLFLPGFRPSGAALGHDTLRKGIEMPLGIKRLKLKKGKVLLYKNKVQ
jgi:hypothetical protein